MIYIANAGLVSALGNNKQETMHNLKKGVAPGMQKESGWLINKQDCMVGKVYGTLPEIPLELVQHNSRNNRLLLAAYAQIAETVTPLIARFGKHRVGVVLGTSTSGLDESDRYASFVLHEKQKPEYYYAMQELGDPARFLSAYLQLTAPTYTISTACSSSSRAIISGCRLLQSDMMDAVIVGGVDTLSRMSIGGFHSLGALSAEQCVPFGEQRKGINVGEAAALLVLTKEASSVAVCGYGESSDAWHMSAPHPEGLGAVQAIHQALAMSHIDAQEMGYINLHGTGTVLNDAMESKVIHQIFAETVPCSSTKYLTGHTLGAAGACEAVLCWMCMNEDLPLPQQVFFGGEKDVSLPTCGLIETGTTLNKPYVMSNSFAFGGNNTSLIFEKMYA